MKQLVLRYNLLTQDVRIQGYPNGIPDCFKAFEVIDGRTAFVDKEDGLLVCYALKDGCNYPIKYNVLRSWCEEVEL